MVTKPKQGLACTAPLPGLELLVQAGSSLKLENPRRPDFPSSQT